MSEDGGGDAIGKLGSSVEILKTVMSVAGESPELKDAGTNIAKSAKTVTELLNNCLLPIAAVNFAFEKGRTYFSEQFSDDLADAMDAIPPENIVEPKASVVAPVLQGLGFSHEEQELKSLYLKLLSSAMDGRYPQRAHPSYSEIIKQLTSDEARMLSQLLQSSNPNFSIVKLEERKQKPKGKMTRYLHLFNLTLTTDKSPYELPSFPAMLENWKRLGLIEIDYATHLVSEDSYFWVNSRPEYLRLKAEIGEENIAIARGIVTKTPFGKNFASAVL